MRLTSNENLTGFPLQSPSLRSGGFPLQSGVENHLSAPRAGALPLDPKLSLRPGLRLSAPHARLQDPRRKAPQYRNHTTRPETGQIWQIGINPYISIAV